MKIKRVCQLTGLSDRTIRYYIEEGLISPSYTENYTGRRTYNFSEKDIKELNDIAVLRKFDFTIEEIRSIISNAETSRAILPDVISRTETALIHCQEKLAALSQINTEQSYSIAELAENLLKASLALPARDEKITVNIAKTLFAALKSVIISGIVWLPIILSLIVVIKNNYQYPVFNPWMVAATALSFFPSVVVLVISKIQFPFRQIIKRVLLVFCVLSVPVSFILSLGIVSKSETTAFENYRHFDADCIANRNLLFQELFPVWPHYFENVKQADGSYETVYSDAKYYYHYYRGFDYTFDIYAQWPLNEAEYHEEISRASALFHNAEANGGCKFAEIKKENYHCLILYSGDEPFTAATDNYSYIIFAGNEEGKIVRYIYCCSLENGADQPYYLSLDW